MIQSPQHYEISRALKQFGGLDTRLLRLARWRLAPHLGHEIGPCLIVLNLDLRGRQIHCVNVLYVLRYLRILIICKVMVPSVILMFVILNRIRIARAQWQSDGTELAQE